MAEIPEHARKMLDELRQDFAEYVEQARRALDMMNLIEGKYDAPRTDFGDLLTGITPERLAEIASEGGVPDRSTGRPAASGRGAIAIRPDQFMGRPPLEAAKMYLGQRGHAASIDEIADAISRGGAAIRGSDWKDLLERSLTRSVADVLKVQEGVFGLTRFYTDEQIARLRATRRQAASKPLKRKAHRRTEETGTVKGKRPKVKLARRPQRTGRNDDDETRQSAAAVNGAGRPLET